MFVNLCVLQEVSYYTNYKECVKKIGKTLYVFIIKIYVMTMMGIVTALKWTIIFIWEDFQGIKQAEHKR